MQRIESRHNERLRDAARLIASSRDRRKTGRCVLEGVHLVDVYCARIGAPDLLVVLDEALARPDVAALVDRVPPARTIVVSRKLLADVAMLPADVAALAVVATPAPMPSSPGGMCLLLENVQDPGNVGSIIRTAAAAGVAQVLLSRQCAFAWSPKVLRAAQGAHFLTAVVEGVELREWIDAHRARRGRAFAAVADAATPLYATDLRGDVAIAIGSEGAGLTPELLSRVDGRVSIPMAAGSQSLNVAAAAAVVLFEAVRQRETARRPPDRAPAVGAARGGTGMP